MSSDDKNSSSGSRMDSIFPDLPRLDYKDKLMYNTDIVFCKEELEEKHSKLRQNGSYVVKIHYKGETGYLKIYSARSRREVRNEVKVYQHLFYQSCEIIPKLLALVTDKNEIIGFVSKEIQGRSAVSRNHEDLAMCMKGMEELHAHGVAHGDPHLQNMIICEGRGMFFDFESSKIKEEHSLNGYFGEYCKKDIIDLVYYFDWEPI